MRTYTKSRHTSCPATSFAAKTATRIASISFSIVFFADLVQETTLSRGLFFKLPKVNVVTDCCHFRSSINCNDGILIVLFV